MQTKEEAFARLAKSKFRSSFYLTKAEKAYCAEKGEAVLRRHAEDFVRQKLAPAHPVNDGKQTPMHGHPVFKAMRRGSENRSQTGFSGHIFSNTASSALIIRQVLSSTASLS